MAESALTWNRWTITRKAAVVQELLRSGDAVEVARRSAYHFSQIRAKSWHPKSSSLSFSKFRFRTCVSWA